MIYNLILILKITYGDLVSGQLKLVTPDDIESEVFCLELNAVADAALDNLVVAVDPNVVLPSTINIMEASKESNYLLKKGVSDTIELASLISLVANLSS